MATVTGGDRLQAALAEINARLASAGPAPSVKVGFLEGSTYDDGTSVPMVAFVNEFGATIQMPARQQTIYRRRNAKGTAFLRKGRFVKRAASNYTTTHTSPAHTIVIPPRPFFRNMIKAKASTWGPAIAILLKKDGYDAPKVLGEMGALIAGQLQQSIQDLTSPPNAASTIRRKGASKPLIDTGKMWQSVAFEVNAA